MTLKWSSKFEFKPGKWIFIPTAESALLGKKIKTEIARHWDAPAYFYHLRSGGHVAALKAHLNNEAFLRLDIQDFFGSVGRSRMVRCLKPKFGYETALEWAHASTVRDPCRSARSIVPFGFVQSPIIASMCLAESALGAHLAKLAKSKLFDLSVYVDDIIVSSKDSASLTDQVLMELTGAAQRSRFTFSAEKTQGPAPSVKAFNIELCHGSIRIEDGRMNDFVRTLKSSANQSQRMGILGYLASVNSDQEMHGRRVVWAAVAT